jgi:hypothetical protein
VKPPAELWTVARYLGEMLDEVVFVGGMIRDLLLTDPAAGPAHRTAGISIKLRPPEWARGTRR